jgi:hypothetical protein
VHSLAHCCAYILLQLELSKDSGILQAPQILLTAVTCCKLSMHKAFGVVTYSAPAHSAVYLDSWLYIRLVQRVQACGCASSKHSLQLLLLRLQLTFAAGNSSLRTLQGRMAGAQHTGWGRNSYAVLYGIQV